jgi:V/A-type H+-transporting ATPase subunit I
VIVKMKKLTLLASEGQREELLERLKKLGVVHVKDVVRPYSEDIETLGKALARAERAIAILGSCSIPKAAERAPEQIVDVPGEVESINTLYAEREELLKNLQYLDGKIELFRPWGGFDPRDLKVFEKRGISIRLYRAPRGRGKKLASGRNDIHVINEDKQYLYLAQTCGSAAEYLPLEEVNLPQENFEDIYKRRESSKNRVEEIEGKIRHKARTKDLITNYKAELESKRTFLNVMHGMGKETGFAYLQGFCPSENVKLIAELAGRESFGYLAEEPDDPNEVPTLIRNPRWINIINPVFKFMNVIPGYEEYDISLWFLGFFSLFFAMLIGDAGYGALFLGVTFFARRKARTAPREPFLLMYVLGAATLVWGTLTGTWFGVERIAQVPFFSRFIVDDINSFVETNQNFMIYLCFVIGVVHLSIAHLLLAFKKINSIKALAEIGWAMIIWGLFFTAGTLVIGRDFPGYAAYLLAGGAGLVLLFANAQKNMLKGVATTLTSLPLSIISSFSDVVSYLRLFAVGYASCVVAASFNDMAMQLGFGSVAAGLGAAFILFFGHALNIVLGFMAVIVHGVRLNMLEFSGQMGMEWSGREYKPFKEEAI